MDYEQAKKFIEDTMPSLCPKEPMAPKLTADAYQFTDRLAAVAKKGCRVSLDYVTEFGYWVCRIEHESTMHAAGIGKAKGVEVAFAMAVRDYEKGRIKALGANKAKPKPRRKPRNRGKVAAKNVIKP